MLKSNESKIWFVAIVAVVGCFVIGDAALAQEKADLSIPAAVGQGKSAVAQQANKRSVGCNCDLLQAPVALKAASAAKTYKPAKRIKLNKLNHRQLSRSTVKFAEVEIVLSDQFNIESISALPRAPGSDLKILDGPRRVRVQLPADCVEALVDEGAEITVLRKFILVERSTGKARTPDRDMATLQRKLDSYDSYCEGSNDDDEDIPDDGYERNEWAYSDIPISCAPGCATVSSIDVHFEIIHTYVGDLIVVLSDYDVTDVYVLWQFEGGGTDNINKTVTGITTFNGEQVNQIWTLWAADGYLQDSGYINDWWIKVYYGSPPPPPPNDECVNAIPVVEGEPYYGSTCGATGVDESSCCGYNDTADVWHSFMPTSTGCFRISLCDSAFDTTLAVYNECGGTELACNDDSCGLQSEVLVGLNAGHTYIIRIAGFCGDAGDYTLTINGSTISPPPNDDCEDAIAVVDEVPYSGSTVCATGTYQSFCSFGDTADVWHSYMPTNTGLVTISLDGSGFGTTLSVFDECGGMELACNDDTCDSLQSEIMMTMTAASTYLIRIAGFCGDAGDYTLSVTSSPCVLPPEPNNPSPVNGANDVPVDTILSWNDSKAKAFQAKSNKAAMPLSKDGVTPKVIYGPDDRLDEYEVIDPNILAVGDSTVALVDACDLIPNYDGTFSLPAQTYADWYETENPYNPYHRPLCSDEPFYDQPVPAFCSGFLVAPDIIATAGHCAGTGRCQDMAVVFGFVMLDADTPVLTIDASEIYYCSEVIVCNGGYQDGALIRLDREVTGHSPLPIRIAGIIPDDEPLLVIGHPVGLPRKYAGGATIRENTESAYFQANLDTYVGNSGSAVFNANTLEVEGILVSGQYDWEPNGPCDSSNRCSDDGCPGWEDVTRITQFADLIPWHRYDVYFDVNCPPTQLVCSDIEVPMCDPCDPCSPDGTLRPGTTYYWQVVAKNSCGETPGPNDPNNCWTFTTAYIDVNVTLNNDWMYQNLPGSNDCNLTTCAQIIDDPLNNTSYSYKWEFILPTDVTLEPNIIGPNDISCCTFAARGCDEPNGISDSGQAFKVRVTVTGDDFGNTGIADANFGIALLGDVNNDCVVNVIDRAIITAFWRRPPVGRCSLRDCDLNCDGRMNGIDRSIVTAIWKGTQCQNDVNEPCPLRSPCP